MKILKTIALFLVLSILTSCGGGGGGGGGESVDPAPKGALVSMARSPERIKIGDRIQVRVYLDDINSAGLILKIRYPDALSYVRETSVLSTGDASIIFGPVTGQATRGGYSYIFYSFQRGTFGNDNHGELVFQLRGIETLDEGKISIDPDIRDTSKDPIDEFSAKNPLFGTEAEASVQVERGY